MSFDVRIRDFRSLKKVDLKLDKGLTVLVGNTNEGKSAVINAIDRAIFNTGTDSDIRSGKRYAGVQVSNESGKFFWRRDSKGKNEKTMYQMNDATPVTKVGRGQLEEVAGLVNITEVRMANNQKEKINFWFQGDHPFLTDRTPGQLFEFISLSSCDEYISILKDMKSDVREINNRIISTTASIDTLRVLNEEKKIFIDSNDGYDDVYVRVITLDNEINAFNEIEDVVNRIRILKAKGQIKSEELKALLDKIKSIEYDVVKSRYISFNAFSGEVAVISGVIDDVRRKSGSLQVLQKQLGIVSSKSADLGNKLVDAGLKCDSLDTLSKQVNDCSLVIDSIKNKELYLRDLNQSITNLRDVLSRVDISKIAAGISRINELRSQITEITSRIQVIKDKKKNFDLKKEELAEVSAEYQVVNKEFEDYKVEIGSCPYCGNTL